jgi:hypothetical protein
MPYTPTTPDEAAAANRADAIFQDFGAADLRTPDIAKLVSDVAIGFHSKGINKACKILRSAARLESRRRAIPVYGNSR